MMCECVDSGFGGSFADSRFDSALHFRQVLPDQVEVR
jgi:hypothetical protein